MDQKERLERIKECKQKRQQLRDKVEAEIFCLTTEIKMLLNSCDHTHHDGASAIKDVYDVADQKTERECEICGACWNLWGERL